MSSPIADLSYRGYEGPIENPLGRWKVIARMTIMSAFKKKWYWIWTLLGSWYYIAILFVMFFLERVLQQQDPELMNRFLKDLVWRDQFLLGFTIGQLPYMLITLIVGSSAISSDRRSNALIVYLSKPCSRSDYLIGKFVGVCTPIFLSIALPAVLFWFIGVLSYGVYGFNKHPWTILQMLGVFTVASAFFTSVVLGLGSLVKQPRLASASYAGVYFASGFFTVLMSATWNGTTGANLPAQSTLLSRLTYASLDGLTIGLAKSMVGTNGAMPFAAQVDGSRLTPYPPLWFPLTAILLIGGLMMILTWRSIKAVEIVR